MGKILITGNPSSGTTFTVGLLTRLDLDTGYTKEEVEENYNGLEIMAGRKEKRRHRRNMWNEHGIDISPQVIKHPFGMEPYPNLLKWRNQLNWDVERVILLVRDTDVIKHHRTFDEAHHNKLLGIFLLEAAEHEWPLHILAFPHAARDMRYCWRVLQPLSGDFDKFKIAWEQHVKPKEVHP